jgi:ferredoxin
MLGELRETCRQLLRDDVVQVVIGYGQREPGMSVYPVFVTQPEQAEQLTWNEACHANLVAYVNRPDVRALGKAAVVVKACDERALVVLEQECQIDRSDIYVIGLACDGVDQPRTAKCQSCVNQTPRFADVVIGTAAETSQNPVERIAPLDTFLQKSPAERMAYWQHEFSRCTKCYACRQVCPLCYCRQCIVDKNRPVRVDTSATLKGNFAWHITRAFHLAGRCVGCDECTRVCPAGIELRLLNQSLTRAAAEFFDCEPGSAPHALPVIGTYSEDDQGSFVR